MHGSDRVPDLKTITSEPGLEKGKPSTRAKWRSCSSARRGVLEKRLTPPTLLERRCYANGDFGGYNPAENTVWHWLMDIRQSLFSLINIGIAVVATFFIFRGGPKTRISRAPLFIVCFLLFLSAGIANLPLAVPRIFERLLGHSVWANYAPPVKLNVTQVGGTWWLVRWSDPIQTAYFWVFLAGVLWAVLNIVQGRSRKLNLFCVCFAVIWVVGSLAFSFACFPFCV